MLGPDRLPAARARAVLYLRQSTHREESISLELQEHEGRAYAERQGYDVVAVESDPGISGRTWNRPAVQRVMAAIEAHEVDVIVLWKWSRLSRSRLDWAVAADRVATAGGRIESATEPLDTTTSTGRLARGMLTEFAAFESERIGDVWKESHARRIRNGMPANGKPRFGYSYSRERGFEIDPITGPFLAETYARYLAGESVYSLTKWLNEGPARPVDGYGVKGDGLWSDRTIRRVMDSGFAAGYIRSRGELHWGVHAAIITPEQWEAYREARGRRASYRRIERSPYLLSGLVRCVCGSSMTAGQFGSAHTAKYRCKAAHEKRTHAGGYVTASFVEEAVRAWLVEREQRLTAEARPRLGRRPATPDPVIAIDAQLAVLAGKLERLAERLIDPGIPHETYVSVRDKYVAEIKALGQARRSITVQARVAPLRVIPEVLHAWDRGGFIEERREILRALILYVEVTPGRPRGTFLIHPRE